MIIKVIDEDKRPQKTNKFVINDSDSIEIKKIRELLNEEELEYVSSNIRNILKITKSNSIDCFTILKNRTKAILEGDCYRVILYIRLSVEDGDVIDGDVSKSIRNQLLMLLDECQKRKWKVVAIFCEEGISGANDDRPEWNKSLKYCECGRTEILLCKSQSRFSRSMEMIEKYLHNKFVEWNVRFVGLVDSTDTSIKGNKKTRQINGLVNEWQVEDQSINTRAVLKNKKSNGLYAAAFTPYGYKKDPEDKYRLIIDEEAGKIVKEIFDMYANGIGYHSICKELNSRRVPIPSDYKRMNGSKYYNWNLQYKRVITYQTEKGDTLSKIADRYYSNEQAIIETNLLKEDNFEMCKDKTIDLKDRVLKTEQIITLPTRQLWSPQTVREILRNETYTGTLVMGKWENKSYKDRSRRKVPKENWIRVPHCHTPIVSQEIWDIITERFKEDGRIKTRKSGEINIFGKKAYCSCCGKAFHMTSGDKRINQKDYLRCSQSKGTNNRLCSNKKLVVIDDLKKWILKKINEQIEKYYDLSEIEKNYYEQNTNSNIDEEIKKLNDKKLYFEKQINKKTNTLTLLYEDRASGIITAEEFAIIKIKNNTDIEDYKLRINEINNYLYELEVKCEKKQNNKKLFEKYKKIEKLDKIVLDEFISKIYIGQYNEETKERNLIIEWNINAY